MIFLNFKTYPQATGEGAVELARIAQEVSQATGVKINLALQATDIFRVAQQIKIPIFGQHLDSVSEGKHTGFTTALALKKAGASGVFLNHSERNFYSFADLGIAIEKASHQDLETLIFAKDVKIAVKVDQFKPTYIALEDPQLIASDMAMIEKPGNFQLIREFIESIRSTPLIGAGIRDREDVFNSLKIGLKGVALSSAFVQASDPRQVLSSLSSAFSPMSS